VAAAAHLSEMLNAVGACTMSTAAGVWTNLIAAQWLRQ
jgi:hypothetical protein